MDRDKWFVFRILFFVAVFLIGFGLALYPSFERASEQRRQHGYEAGKAGLPVEACPYNGWPDTKEWKQGWIQGAMEREMDRVE